MGAVLGFIIILLMMYCLGVSMKIITGIILGIFLAALAAMALFFWYSAFASAAAKKKTAVFSKIDNRFKGKFPCAFYIIDGNELPNAFPCEILLKSRLYDSQKEVTIKLSEKRGIVYDSYTLITIAVGVVLCTVLLAAGVILAAGLYLY